VRPRLGRDLALGLLLDAVVADRAGRVEALVDVCLRELLDQPGRDRVRGPDAGVAVGLQLRPHGLALRALPVAADAVEDAELVLDVVAILVCEHVGLREVAAGAEPRLELIEEIEVDVDELVGRAVERADLRARKAAAGVDLTREEDGVCVRVLLAAPGKDAVPELLDAVDDGNDAAVLSRVRVLAGLALGRDLARRVALADALVLERRELSQAALAPEHGEEQVDDEHCEAEPAAAHRKPSATQAAAADVAYLARVEAGSSPETHVPSVPARA
jgi:hypothetical protein